MEIFDYDNVLLLPRQCRVESRSECDPGVVFGRRRFNLPVVAANMSIGVLNALGMAQDQLGTGLRRPGVLGFGAGAVASRRFGKSVTAQEGRFRPRPQG